MRECGNGGWSTTGGMQSLSSFSPPVGMGSAPGAPWPWPVATLLDNGDGRYHHSLNQHHHAPRYGLFGDKKISPHFFFRK